MPSISVRTYLSEHHLRAARLFSRRAKELEEARGGRDEQIAYVIGTILCAAAFLEATINEFFENAFDAVKRGTPYRHLQPMKSATLKQIADAWEKGFNKYTAIKCGVDPKQGKQEARTLYKFRIAMAVIGKPRLENDVAAYQDAADVIRLRNETVHYRPEWVTTVTTVAPPTTDPSAVRAKNLEERLCGKFELNPLVGAGNPFFPDKCLSHGCCRWATESVTAFAKSFFLKLGLEVPAY